MFRFPKFRSDEKASVTVEFVLISPLIMLWILGSYVFFDTYRQGTRAAKATYLVGDIISRLEVVDNDDLTYTMDELFDRLTPRAPDGKWVRITSVIYDADADEYSIGWSTVIGDQQYRAEQDEISRGDRDADDFSYEVVNAAASEADLPMDLLPDSISDGDTFILTESFVPYNPMVTSTMTWFKWAGLNDVEWRNRVINRPRFVNEITNPDYVHPDVADTGDDDAGDDFDM